MVAHPEHLIHHKGELRNGVIGGTGFADKAANFETIPTDYGNVRVGHIQLGGRDTVFIARHQELSAPLDVNNRANVEALKLLSVERVVTISAAGQLRADVPPGHLVAVSGLLYFANDRKQVSFNHRGTMLMHTPLSSLYDNQLHAALVASWKESEPAIAALYANGSTMGLKVGFHDTGTYFNSPPPQFNTEDFEEFLRRVYGDKLTVIGQTLMPEAALIREFGMTQTALAMCTDPSTFPGGERPVTHAGPGGVTDVATITSQAALILVDAALRKIPDDYFDPFSHDAIPISVNPRQVQWNRLRMRKPRLAVILDQAFPPEQRVPYTFLQKARYLLTR